MPFTPKEDRQAQHVADHYGGGKRALGIGYGVVQKNRARKRKRGAGRKRRRNR